MIAPHAICCKDHAASRYIFTCLSKVGIAGKVGEVCFFQNDEGRTWLHDMILCDSMKSWARWNIPSASENHKKSAPVALSVSFGIVIQNIQ